MAKNRRYRGSCVHCGEYRQITLRWDGGAATCLNCAVSADYKKRGVCYCCSLVDAPLEDDHPLGRALQEHLNLKQTMPVCLNCHEYISDIKLPIMNQQRKFVEQTGSDTRRAHQADVTIADLFPAIVAAAHAYLEARKYAKKPNDERSLPGSTIRISSATNAHGGSSASLLHGGSETG
jgi:hypothetical protein